MAQENSTRNGGIGNGAHCQELWGTKGELVAQGGGQYCWGVMSWEASTLRDIPEGSAEP